MKKEYFLFGATILASAFLVASASAQSLKCQTMDTLPKTITEDTCIYNSVKLQDISKKDNIVSAKVNGDGSLVLQSKLSGGFPRLILLGNTTATATTLENGSTWSGELSIPKATRTPNKNKFFQAGASKNSKVEVIGTYQIGTHNTDMKFSEKAYASFRANVPNNTQLMIATETLSTAEILRLKDRSISNIEWNYDPKKFCVVKSSICMVELPSTVNRIALIRLMNDTCPDITIENGGFSAAPECKIVCDNGFGFDTTQNKCVPSDQITNQTQFEETSPIVRQGYFRYRDTRGGQLTKAPGADDLNASEKEFVDGKNAAVGNRKNKVKKNTNNKKENENESLWKQFQEFVWTTDTTGEYHKSRYAKSETKKASNTGNSTTTSPTENKTKREVSTPRGGILPRTGSGAFVALAIAGIATMAFALRRRR